MRKNPYNLFENDYFESILPICRKENNDFPIIGSAFLCKYKNEIFIISAGHIFDDPILDINQIYVLKHYKQKDDVTYIPIRKFDINYINSDSGDDFALIYIGKDDTNFNNIVNIYTIFDIKDDSLFGIDNLVFLGFPTSKYEKFKNPQQASLVRYTGKVLHPPYKKYRSIYISEDLHLIADFRSENVIQTINGSETIVPKMPNLQGMSGGPVFGIKSKMPDAPLLLGVAISYSKEDEIIVALQICAIMKYLDNFLSDRLGKLSILSD